MILVDTSVWVDHLRHGHPRLADLLNRNAVVVHPFVIGEVALGVLGKRREILALLAELPRASALGHEEALGVIEQHRLAGRGIGWVDVHLIASAMLERLPLWTFDRRLAAVARDLAVAWTVP